MATIKIQNSYSTTTTGTIPASGDFTVTLAQAPVESKGWVTFDNANPALREYAYFNSRSGATITVKAVNRTNPQAHASSATIQINNMAEMFQYLSEIAGNFGYVEKVGGLNITVFGGQVRNAGVYATVSDTNLTLPASQTSYIYLDIGDNTIKQTLNLVTAQLGFTIATVVTSASAVSTVTYIFPKVNVGDGSGGSGITVWGDIIGTLSAQADLQSALDAKQGDITLTTTGTSGAATLIGDTLNIPQYAGGGGGAVDSVNGYVGAVVLVKGDIGLGNADNTSDVNKPISTSTQTALNAKQDTIIILPIANGGTSANTAVGAIDAISTQGTTIASAATTNLATATGKSVDISGTTTITSFGTAAAGVERSIRFTGAGLTLTHNATSLILPTSASISTLLGDTAIFRSLGSGNWVCVSYQRATGSALAGSTVNAFSLTKSASQSIPQGATTRVTWDTETFDTNGVHTGSSGDVVLTAGYWVIQATIELDSIGSGTTDLALSISGGANTIFGDSTNAMGSYTGAPTRTFNGYGVLFVATTSTIGVDISKTFGGSANATTKSRFVGYKL